MADVPLTRISGACYTRADVEDEVQHLEAPPRGEPRVFGEHRVEFKRAFTDVMSAYGWWTALSVSARYSW